MSKKRLLIEYFMDKLPFSCAVLKATLIDKDMSGSELATLLEVSKQMINMWIIGIRTPHNNSKQKLATVLGIDVKEFDKEYWGF